MKKLADRITIHPGLCHSAPTIRALRYPVKMILELLDSGMTADELLNDYPDLERADIHAVLEFQADERNVCGPATRIDDPCDPV